MRMGMHAAARLTRARAVFREWYGAVAEADRAAQISALPVVEWKGQALKTLRCHGSAGKGPHDVNVQEAMLWQLIELRRWRCPYHA